MKIGFIDYFLDEYHANSFPEWIKEASNGEMEVAYAYAKIDHPGGGLTTDEWCAKYNVMRINTIEELVEKSDAIVVLSPDNPEYHEELCQVPLASGKRVYVDKTFAETKESAKRIFAIAEKHNTPCYSASSLPYAEEYRTIGRDNVENIVSWGPGRIETYSVHQVEPIIYLMGTDITTVMFIGTDKQQSYVCEFTDGRKAVVSHHDNGCPFGMTVDFKDGTNKTFNIESAFFKSFAADLVNFFRTGEASVTHEETITGIAVIEAADKAAKKPGTWVLV